MADIDDQIDGARASRSWLFRDRDRTILSGLLDKRDKAEREERTKR